MSSAAELIADGRVARRESRSEDARGLFAQAISQALKEGNELARVDALNGLANSERDLGRLEGSAALYAESVELLRTMNDPLRLAHTVRHQADVAREQSRVEFAVAHYNEAIGIYRARDATAPLDLANALRGYALLREELGDLAAARLSWAEAMKLYEQAGVQAGVDEAKRRTAGFDAT